MLNTLAGIIASSGGAVGGDYESIATVTVGAGGTSTITFSGISSNYTNLQIRALVRGTTTYSGGLSLYVGAIGPTSTTTKRHWLDGNGSSALSSFDGGAGIATMVADGGALANSFSAVVLDILDWNNANKNLTFRALGGYDSNGGTSHVTLGSGLTIPSGGAVTGFTLQTDGNFVQYTTFALYGIKG